MQNHAIVGVIAGVGMRRPVGGVEVQFNVARNFGIVTKAQTRAAKIRAPEQIPFAGMKHRYAPAIDKHGRSAIEVAAEPDFLEQLFRKRKGSVKPLNFRDGSRKEWKSAGHSHECGGREKARQEQGFAKGFSHTTGGVAELV